MDANDASQPYCRALFVLCPLSYEYNIIVVYLKTFVQQRFHFILVCSKGRGIVQQSFLVTTSAFFRCTPYASVNLELIDDKFTMPFPTNVSPYLSVSYVKYLIRRVLCLRWNRMSCIVRICTHKPTPLLLSPRKVVAWSYHQASSCEKTLPHKNVHKNASLTIIHDAHLYGHVNTFRYNHHQRLRQIP